MIKRDYYSSRNNKIQDKTVSFDILKKLFVLTYKRLKEEGYFQKYFGVDCTDGYINGILGSDISSIMFINLKRENVWPILTCNKYYDEDTLFDVIEFMYDHCSKPLEGNYHDWNQCGFHYTTFDDVEGQKYFREAINPFLKDYGAGYELSNNGEVLLLPESGFEKLMETPVPSQDEHNINQKIEKAKNKYRRHKSSFDDRKEAVRELADILEYLRPQALQHLNTKDENDLFNIINTFGIRHHRQTQKTNYDENIWYSWMFYFFLSTIYALLKLIQKNVGK